MDLLEIGVALATKTLSFFIGTGFSRYLTNDSAPSWLELLVDLTSVIDDKRRRLEKKLFNHDSSGNVVSAKVDLSIVAQMLELEFSSRGGDIREAAADIIKKRTDESTLNEGKIKRLNDFFRAHGDTSVVTTNYDTLLTDQVLIGAKPILANSPIPRSNAGNVFHIHGCVADPRSIVLTISDYFRFQHRDSYLARKFYTLLQETTMVILGYSLGDFNLNSILNEAQSARAVSLRKSDIYLVNKSPVDEIFKQFYSYTYGIHVLDECAIDEFFDDLEKIYAEAEQLVREVKNLPDVVEGKKQYTDSFLKLRNALSEILVQASVLGLDLTSPSFITLLTEILERKQDFTRESGAWDQYDQLAEWLIEIGSRIDVVGTKLEKEYRKVAEYSLSQMSRDKVIGKSWDAFSTWRNRFSELRPANQKLIKELVDKEFGKDDDAFEIIS